MASWGFLFCSGFFVGGGTFGSRDGGFFGGVDGRVAVVGVEYY